MSDEKGPGDLADREPQPTQERDFSELQTLVAKNSPAQLDQYADALLATIKEHLPQLEKLLDRINDVWCYEDGFYRFYHQSFKVYSLQHLTAEATRL